MKINIDKIQIVESKMNREIEKIMQSIFLGSTITVGYMFVYSPVGHDKHTASPCMIIFASTIYEAIGKAAFRLTEGQQVERIEERNVFTESAFNTIKKDWEATQEGRMRKANKRTELK